MPKTNFDYLTEVYPATPSPQLSTLTLKTFELIFGSSPAPITERVNVATRALAFNIEDMRVVLQALLDKHMIAYPEGMSHSDYSNVTIGGLQCCVIRHENYEFVPTFGHVSWRRVLL